MIYLFFKGERGEQEIVAAYEGPAGLAVYEKDFVQTLGMRPPPRWSEERYGERPQEFWEDSRAWQKERDDLLQEKGITDVHAAHKGWLDAHPSLTKVGFEEINSL